MKKLKTLFNLYAILKVKSERKSVWHDSLWINMAEWGKELNAFHPTSTYDREVKR